MFSPIFREIKIKTNVRCQIFLKSEIPLWEIYLTVIKASEHRDIWDIM